MPRPGGASLAAAACLAPVVGAWSLSGRADGCADGKQVPGSPDYCLLLGGLYTTAGKFKPKFSPDNTEYQVTLDSNLASYTLYAAVDVSKYHSDGLPEILVDGAPSKYAAGEPVEVEVDVSQGVWPMDHTMAIVVRDPKRRERLKSYSVRFRKAPDFTKALQVEDITLTYGKESHLRPLVLGDVEDFDVAVGPASDQNVTGSRVAITARSRAPRGTPAYIFEVPAEETRVRLDVRCPGAAKAALYMDEAGAEAKTNDTQVGRSWTFDLADSSTRLATASCYFDDANWTSVRRERFYSIKIARGLQFDGHLSIALPPSEGVCEAWQSGGRGRGFRCRVFSKSANLTARIERPNASLNLLGRDGPAYRLQSGVEQQVRVPTSGSYTLEVSHGTFKAEFPVMYFRPAKCSSLRCPAGQANRQAHRAPPHRGEDAWCEGPSCTLDADLAQCCAEVARCSSYRLPCPDGQGLRHDADEGACKGAACGAQDASACCTPRATCDEFPLSCPAGEGLRRDATGARCQSDACGHVDTSLCCVDTAPCDKINCPQGASPGGLAGAGGCGNGSCAEEDVDPCCVWQEQLVVVEGLLRLRGVDFAAVSVDPELSAALKSAVEGALRAGAGGHPTKVKAAFGVSLSAESVDVYFIAKSLDRRGEVRDRLREAAGIRAKVAKSVAEARKISAARVGKIEVPFYAISEAELDAANAGVYCPATLEACSSKGHCTVSLPFGEQADVDSSDVRTAGGPLLQGAKVQALIPLQKLNLWQQEGVNLDFLELYDHAASTPVARAATAQPTATRTPRTAAPEASAVLLMALVALAVAATARIGRHCAHRLRRGGSGGDESRLLDAGA